MNTTSNTKYYTLLFDDNFEKSLRKIDVTQQKIILSWIAKRLMKTENSRIYGKSLKGNLKQYWSYRIGVYRILAEIEDDKLIFVLMQVDHRRKVYH